MNPMKSEFSQKLIVLIAAAALSTAALADGKNHRKGHKHERHDRVHQSLQAYGKVIDVTPIYREVRVSTPRKECWDEPVRTRHTRRSASQAGPTLVGALLGGAIGHQIGKGRGKQVATALGTVIGAQVANDASRHNRHDSFEQYTRYEEVCEVTERVNYQQVIDGYQVTYKYKGQRFNTRMPYDPGDRIKLRIRVEPVI